MFGWSWARAITPRSFPFPSGLSSAWAPKRRMDPTLSRRVAGSVGDAHTEAETCFRSPSFIFSSPVFPFSSDVWPTLAFEDWINNGDEMLWFGGFSFPLSGLLGFPGPFQIILIGKQTLISTLVLFSESTTHPTGCSTSRVFPLSSISFSTPTGVPLRSPLLCFSPFCVICIHRSGAPMSISIPPGPSRSFFLPDDSLPEICFATSTSNE